MGAKKYGRGTLASEAPVASVASGMASVVYVVSVACGPWHCGLVASKNCCFCNLCGILLWPQRPLWPFEAFEPPTALRVSVPCGLRGHYGSAASGVSVVFVLCLVVASIAFVVSLAFVTFVVFVVFVAFVAYAAFVAVIPHKFCGISCVCRHQPFTSGLCDLYGLCAHCGLVVLCGLCGLHGLSVAFLACGLCGLCALCGFFGLCGLCAVLHLRTL